MSGIRVSYEDPQLWLRLGPLVKEEYDRVADMILARSVGGYDEYCEQIGRLQGLRWVLEQSREMNRREEIPVPVDEDEY